MATRTEDFVTIASIIKREIQKRKKQKKLKAEDETELTLLKKKKKKKKKEDKKKVQNNKKLKNNKAILTIRKLYTETCDDNNKHLNKDKTGYSNLSKDEFPRNIPIANTSEGDSLFKKKKKIKKRDKIMVRNDNNFKNDIATLKVEKFYTETCDDNYKHLINDKTGYSNLSKDEFLRNIPITNTSESDSLFKKKKKKKKGDKKMVQNDEIMKNDIGTLKVGTFYNETCVDNDKRLYKDETMDYNFNIDNLIRRISIANASEDVLLFKKKKKKKRDKKMVQKDKYLKNDKAALKVEQLYNDTCDDNVKYLNKININASNLNKDNSTIRIQIANASEHNEELTLLKSPLKKSKLKKKKSKMAIKEDIESSKYKSIQKNFKNMEDLKIYVSEEQSNEIYNDPAMITTPYNSRILKVYEEEYPDLFQKLFKNKKKDKKKSIKADKKYSKNDSLQSVDMDVETYYNSNNSIDDDGEKKLEIFDSRDDHTSEYRTMTDTGIYFSRYCNQTFNNVNGVHSHENVLTGNTPLQCDVCFKTVSCKSKLHIHKRTHTGEKPYACNVCANSFSRKDHLVVHKRTHTGERPYTCNICGRLFSLKSILVIHYRIHTGERPYECGQCEKKFSTSGGRLRHTRRVHIKCL